MRPDPRHDVDSRSPEPAAAPCVLRFRVARTQGMIATLFAGLREHGLEIVRWVARIAADPAWIDLTVVGSGTPAAAAFAESLTGAERRIA